MTLKTLVRKVRPVVQTVRYDLKDYFNKLINAKHANLTNEEKKYLNDLRRDGYAIIENFWSREKALSMRDQLEAFLKGGKNKELENGAYLRIRGLGDDEGVCRIYHVEGIVSELESFRK